LVGERLGMGRWDLEVDCAVGASGITDAAEAGVEVEVDIEVERSMGDKGSNNVEVRNVQRMDRDDMSGYVLFLVRVHAVKT